MAFSLCEFVEAFTSDDSMFLDSGNELERQILAGAIIIEFINKKNKESINVALALKSGRFGIPDSEIINIEILNTVINFLEEEAILKRKTSDVEPVSTAISLYKGDIGTVEDCNTYLKEVSSYIRAFVIANDKNDSALKHRVKVLEEEANIHWWLFRSFSTSPFLSLAVKPRDSEDIARHDMELVCQNKSANHVG